MFFEVGWAGGEVEHTGISARRSSPRAGEPGKTEAVPMRLLSYFELRFKTLESHGAKSPDAEGAQVWRQNLRSPV